MKHKVLIMRCDDYDPAKIASLLKEGMEELGVRPRGKTILKPNCVIAHPDVFPHAFTRTEFLEGAIMAAKEKGEAISDLSVAERSGITLPTRFCFRKAGYNSVIRKQGIRACYLDESKQVPVRLKDPASLRDLIFVPKPIAECDFLINLPKFKAHPWTLMTLSLKNFIGLQDDRHRLVDHNSFLEHKIADLQEVVQPGFIAIDAIIAGQKMMLTPTPFHMGAIVMGTNSCAVDAVCCRMVHVEPRDLIHLRLASERGYGPMNLDEIQVAGDFPLDEVQQRTKGFQLFRERIDDYFGGEGNLRCIAGKFPEAHSEDYCWGGCPGALQEAVHIFKQYHPDILHRMKKVRYVVGKLEGPLELDPDEKVIFAGDCTSWEGTIDGEKVEIKGCYKRTGDVDARKTKTNDMILKILAPLWHCLTNGSRRYIHAKGCPLSVGAHVNYLASMARIPNVNFDPRNVMGVNIAYWEMRFHRLINRIFG